MIEDFILKPIDKRSADFQKVSDMYENSFPKEERQLTLEGFIELSEWTGFTPVLGAYVKDNCIGFLVYAQCDEFVFGLFFAASEEIRGQGYGRRILKSFLSYIHEKPLLAVIEDPNVEAENKEQRVRRARFYENQGFEISDVKIQSGVVDYCLIASKPDLPIKEYFAEYCIKASSVMKEYGNRLSSQLS